MHKSQVKIGGLYFYNYYYFLLFPTAKAAEFARTRALNWAPFNLSADDVPRVRNFWLNWYDKTEPPNRELMEKCDIPDTIHSLAYIKPGDIFSIVEIKESVELGKEYFLAKILSKDGVGWTAFSSTGNLDKECLYQVD